MEAQAETVDTAVEFLERRCRCGRTGCGEARGGNPAHIAVTTRGAFAVHVGGAAHLARPGAAILASADIEYRVSHPGEEGHDYMVIAVGRDFADEAAFGGVAGRGAREIEYGPERHHRVLRAAQRMRGGRADRLDFDEAAADVLACFLGGDAGRYAPRSATARSREVRAAEVEIAGRFRENLGLRILADRAGWSPFHLSRRFRRETGLTTTQYRMRIRLCHALDRLMAGEDDLTGLALDLGFSDHSHLTAACTRVLGAAPSAIRRQGRSERQRLGDTLRRELSRPA